MKNKVHIMNSKKIVIIGGGIAGISCAAELKKLGFNNVTLLEGKDRLGGRIHTINHGAKALDLGAQWICGDYKNLMYKLAVKNGTISGSNYAKNLLKFPNFHPEVRTIFIKVFNFLQECWKNIPLHNQSFQMFLESSFHNHIVDIMKDTVADRYINGFYSWYCNFFSENFVCDLNVTSTSPLESCFSGSQMLPKEGCVTVIDLLSNFIPDEWILKNKIVSSVNWLMEEVKETDTTVNSNSHCKSEQVKVVCMDDSSYFADHVIITIPLGCLKDNAQSMFSPHLPRPKQEAIKHMCLGYVNKIYLEFDYPFWEPTDIYHIILEEDSSTKNEREWYSYISNFSYVHHHSNLLSATISGEGSRVMETMSSDDIIYDCVKLLEKILNKTNLPQPCNIIMSSWSSDLLSKGSSSHPSIESEKMNFGPVDLAEPIFTTHNDNKHPTLMFAGEATHPYYFATIHGAYETGIREANRLYSSYNSSNIIPPPVSCYKKVSVVVIGGGTAGLACAHNLISYNIKDILILEALDRVGGRIHTVPQGPFVIELGAQWIHGEVGNALFDFCKVHDLIDQCDTSGVTEGRGIFCTSHGTVIAKSLVEEVNFKLAEIKDLVNQSDYSHGCEPLSIADIFQNEFGKYISTCNDMPKVKELKWAIFGWFLRFEVIDNACNNLKDITTIGYSEWIDTPGYFYTNLKDGFHSFINALKRDFPSNILHTSKPVKCIHWNKEFSEKDVNGQNQTGPVVVECLNGDFYAAKFVVVTASCGFLKSHMNTFFNPSLPEAKQIAISTIGFGTINKIYLEFEFPFWDTDVLGYQLVWLNDVEESMCSIVLENSWVKGISGFDRVRGQPNVLVAWIGGPYAKDMEKQSDEAVTLSCVRLLQMFLNRKDIPYPSKLIRSSWFTNPYIKGSFSYRPSEFYKSGSSVVDLKRQLWTKYCMSDGTSFEIPTVQFAGEATSLCHFATVHGALSSGLEAAEKIVQCFEKVKAVTTL